MPGRGQTQRGDADERRHGPADVPAFDRRIEDERRRLSAYRRRVLGPVVILPGTDC
jgi:hypothetical protein